MKWLQFVPMLLRDYINQRGIPISKFGQRVGVHKRQTMHKYVWHKSKPSREIMEKIAVETGGLVLPTDFDCDLTMPVESAA